MEHHSYSISPEVFERFPGYVRGVVIAHDVTNGASPGELVQMLREAEASVRARVSIEQIAEEPRIKAWRDAYRAFGAKPAEFRSSVEAMARRALRGDELPAINALVDIGNIISLRHLIPAGGHAIDVLKGDIALRFATGDEEFVPFGTNDLEHPLPGEVIFVEGSVGPHPALDVAAGQSHSHPPRDPGHRVQRRRTAAADYGRDRGSLRGGRRPREHLLRRHQPDRLSDGGDAHHLAGAVGRAGAGCSGAAPAGPARRGVLRRLGLGALFANDGRQHVGGLIGGPAHSDAHPLERGDLVGRGTTAAHHDGARHGPSADRAAPSCRRRKRPPAW